MSWVAVGLFLWLAAVGAEGWWLRQTLQIAARTDKVLQQRRAELAHLLRQSPALTPETTDALAAEVAAARRLEAEIRGLLQKDARGKTARPASSMDAYFAITETVAKLRAASVREGVETEKDENFGFATHAESGPEPERIAAVHRQLINIEHLLTHLLSARPKALVSVQRERPRKSEQDAVVARSSGAPREEAQDFCVLDSRLSLASPGVVATEAYRLEFVGHTDSLRAFLNALVSSPLPWVIRRVDAERVAAPAAKARLASQGDAPQLVPIVTTNLSRFVVYLEWVEAVEHGGPET